MKTRSNQILNSVSLFSGCMGLDLGLELAGVRAAACVEKDPSCLATIHLNRPQMPCFDDICSATADVLTKAAGTTIDAVVGGPPCQSFSTIGRRGCLEDARGKMLLEYIRVVGELSPRFFVMENVSGLLSAKLGSKPLMPWVISRFEKLGYSVGWWKLDAFDYGSPQKRPRVIILGNRDGDVLMPTPCRPLTLTLRDAIGELEDEPGECGKFGPKLASVLRKIPEGGDWRSLAPKARKVAMGNADLKSGGLTAFYRRLSYDRPCPTLLTSPLHRATTLCHPRHTRPLSVEEYKRIQGFPSDWQLAGNLAAKYRQLGNAVPVALAEAIGRSLVAMNQSGARRLAV
jgi:DNA (cytosine-5)-methyltransferase 1